MFQLTKTLIRPTQLNALRASVRNISVGAKVPSVPVYEGSPGNEVNLAEETASGKSILIGVPGAFSPACSASHIPGYIKNLKAFADKGYKDVYVVAVNDAFVTKAWGEELAKDVDAVKFLADPAGEFTKAADLLFDATKFFGNQRSKRYALLLQDGKVTQAFVEPDNTSIDVSGAEKVLEKA